VPRTRPPYPEEFRREAVRLAVNDGIIRRGVTVEATTHLGRRALRIVETLHGAHPFNGLKRPERGDWYV
jgi:hypothetical protein